MNARTVRVPKKRFETPENTDLGIISWGENNLYPFIVRDVVQNSSGGEQCLERYIDFLSGNGFYNKEISEFIFNDDGETGDDLCQYAANDVGEFHGLAFHFTYNADGKCTDVRSINFDWCRLCQENENGDIEKIAYFDDWEQKKTVNGKRKTLSKSNIDYIDVFNPDPEVVKRQIVEAGGVLDYKGQILWISAAGKWRYPKTKYDKVVTQLSTDEGLANISYRNVRNNFHIGKVLVFKKGSVATDYETEQERDENRNSYNGNDIDNEINKLMTDENAGGVMIYETEYDEQVPQAVDLSGKNYDKDFTFTSDFVKQEIYSAFNQEFWYRILKGSVGLGGSDIQEAFEYYSATTSTKRRMIERAFGMFVHLFGFDKEGCEIEPLRYVPVGTVTGDSILAKYGSDVVDKIIELVKDGSDVSFIKASMMFLYGIDDKDVDEFIRALDADNNNNIENIPEGVLKDLTVDERRELAGFEPLDEEFANESVLAERLGVGGTDAFINLYSAENLNIDEKKAALKLLFGLSDEQINELFV